MPYAGCLRHHLALKVLEDGKSILFDDSWDHEVYDKSDDVRAVLIIDVLQPMRWHLHMINWLVMCALGRYAEETCEARANLRRLT